MKNNLTFIILLLLTLSSCIRESGEEYEGANISVGDKLPALNLQMNNNTVLTNADLNGKVSVIMLFTTTCPDCRNQLPAVEQLYNAYKDNAQVQILGISRSEGKTSISNYWADNGLTFPYSPQDDRGVYSQFASTIVPRIYISDKTQTVRHIYLDRPTATFDQLNDDIQNMLAD